MAGAHGGSTGPVSLLFTPTSLKTGDGSRTPDQRGGLRSPRSSASLFVQPSRGGRWEATPTPSRRRSLTPGSAGLARDTQPPPPTASLADGLLPGQDSAGPMDISPGRDEGAAALLRPPAPRPAPYDGCWVTVFGLGPDDLPDVLRELGRCGELLHWGTYGDGPAVNWVHLRFATVQGAQRALLRDGRHVSSSAIVGVRPVEPTRQAELEEAVKEEEEGGRATGAWTPSRRLPTTTRPAVSHLAPPPPVLPVPAGSAWSKLCEAVLGL